MNLTTYNDLQFDEMLDAQEQKAKHDAAHLRSDAFNVLLYFGLALATELTRQIIQGEFADMLERGRVKRVVAGEAVYKGDLVSEGG